MWERVIRMFEIKSIVFVEKLKTIVKLSESGVAFFNSFVLVILIGDKW